MAENSKSSEKSRKFARNHKKSQESSGKFIERKLRFVESIWKFLCLRIRVQDFLKIVRSTISVRVVKAKLMTLNGIAQEERDNRNYMIDSVEWRC